MLNHTVIVRFNKGVNTLTELDEMEKRLEKAIRDAGVGVFDGADVPPDIIKGHLYMYGPDGDALFEVVRPILESFSFMDGAVARIRYGPPQKGVRSREVTLGLFGLESDGTSNGHA